MFKKLLDHKLEVLAGIVLILMLGLIRNFENQLFYDPLLQFFKGDYQNELLPDYLSWRLYANYLLRYVLNTMVSLALLYVIFKKREIIKIAAVLYLFFAVLLLIALYCALTFQDNMLIVFYIRRFVIQPIFLLLFVPGFYYQEYMVKK